ncbi:MAG: hypothetical protein EBW87_00170 [Burkholderiaceae bacterium]|nr:hypothetical protein [Burkholderiaceae bacterium]
MGIVSGDITEILVNHPTVGSKVLFPKSGTDSTLDTGGFRTQDNDDDIDGGGRNIQRKNRKRWSAEVTLAWDMNTSDELDYLTKLAQSSVEADFTITHINGTVWGGKGSIVGDIKGNGNTAELPAKFAGGNRLQRIA